MSILLAVVILISTFTIGTVFATTMGSNAKVIVETQKVSAGGIAQIY